MYIGGVYIRGWNSGTSLGPYQGSISFGLTRNMDCSSSALHALPGRTYSKWSVAAWPDNLDSESLKLLSPIHLRIRLNRTLSGGVWVGVVVDSEPRGRAGFMSTAAQDDVNRQAS